MDDIKCKRQEESKMLSMKITYDKEAHAVAITLRKDKVAKTKEINWNVIADFDRKGNILGIEILGVSSAPIVI